MITIARRLARASLFLAILLTLLVVASGRAGAQNNGDISAAGTFQVGLCELADGRATVDTDMTVGGGMTAVHVLCLYADGSGWSCSNWASGTTTCFAFRANGQESTGRPKGGAIAGDVVGPSAEMTPSGAGPAVGETRGQVRVSPSGGMAPLEEDGS